MRQRQTDAQASLADAEQRIAALSGNVDQIDQRAAALVASARQQALEVYIEGEPASTPFALVNALALSDVNDAAWSLGVLRVSQAQSLDLLRQATSARPAANTELTTAIAQRDTLRLELARIEPVISGTEADLQAAQSSLDTYVLRLAPATVEGLTTVVFDAYQRAATRLATEQPQCGLRWELLAAIGKTESNHGAGRIDVNGDSITHIIGIPIGPDTDGGALDDDATKDHAAGPMQFIPIAWNAYGSDGNGDGKADPHNIFDATLAAGRFLCKSAGSLTLLTREGVIRAIWAYNPNDEYLRVVGARFEALASDVANGWFSSADLPKPAAPAPDPGAATPGVDGNQPPAAPVTAHRPARRPPSCTPLPCSPPTAWPCPPPAHPCPRRAHRAAAYWPGAAGVLRCVTAPADAAAPETLDPCQVAPFDPTLLACLPDPEQPARLVRVATPLPAATPSPAPPYYALVLTGGDRCLPVAGAGAAPPPPVTPTVPTAGAALRFAPAQAAVVAPAQAPDPTTSTTSTTTPDPTTTATGTSTTEAPTTTTTVAATTTTATTVAATTTTLDPAATTTTTTVAASGPPATYRCSSGADVLDQPATGTAAWTVHVHQPGIADRQIGVIAAWA